MLVGHPGSTCWAPRYVAGGVSRDRMGRAFGLFARVSGGQRPAGGRRSLLGTPVVLVGHPGSGFCAGIARIARLRRSRDAGVAGAEPRIRGICDV